MLTHNISTPGLKSSEDSIKIFHDPTLYGNGTRSSPLRVAVTGIVPTQTGHSGQYLTTDGTTSSWATISLSPAGSNTQLQFNNGGSFGASSNLTWNGTTFTINAGLTLGATNTAPGTTGNRTINKASGTVNIAAAGTSITVTNSLCTTSSIIFASIRNNDSTALVKNIVPSNGAFTINMNAAVTAETSIGFLIIN